MQAQFSFLVEEAVLLAWLAAPKLELTLCLTARSASAKKKMKKWKWLLREAQMPKPILEFAKGEAGTASSSGDIRRSPLSDLVSENLRTKRMRQVDFCRQTGFDQGLLSKILSSVVNTLNVETALKLADGLGLPPTVVFEAIGKKDVDDLLRRFYSTNDRVT